MKRLITASRYTSDGGYLYIFKHGIGPGTIPSDVSVVKTKDLPNYYTAVWLDRFLTADELKKYDIPSETQINRYLDRIGYCQKNGDVVPCDEVEACGEITASSRVTSWGESMYGGYYFNYIDDRGDVSGERTETLQELKAKAAELGLDIKHARRFDNTGDSLGIKFDDVDACDDIMASEDDEDEIYWVQAYYSKPHHGIAEDFSTNDWDAALDKLVEYANKGYYVVFENCASGEGYEYDPDEVLAAVEFGDIYTLRRLQSLYEG